MKSYKELILGYVQDYETKLNELIARYESEREENESKREITIKEAVDFICDCGWIIQHNMAVANIARNELWDYLRSNDMLEAFPGCGSIDDVVNMYSAEEFLTTYAQYKAGGDIAIGDEVVHIGSTDKGSVVFVNENIVKVIMSKDDKLSVAEWNRNEVQKTGEHSPEIEQVVSNDRPPIERLSDDDAEVVID